MVFGWTKLTILPKEPREHNLGEVLPIDYFFCKSFYGISFYSFVKINFNPTTRKTLTSSFDQKSSSYKKFHQRQNYRKGGYNMAHYRKSAKKVKNEVQERKNMGFGKLLFKICAFLCPFPSILTISNKQCGCYI